MVQKKVCLLGATGVGKTSLIKQYVEGIFSNRYLTSIGVKVDKKVVALPDKDIQLMLWDIEGIDRYCGFQPKYLRGAAAYIIVADQTRQQSLNEGMEIHKMCREVTEVPAFLALSKSDLESAWDIEQSESDPAIKQFAKYFSTSAKTGDQVEDMFLAVAQSVSTS